MALRNVTKACLVLVALFALTTLVVIANPQPPLQAQAEEPPQRVSLEAEKEAHKTIAEIPLELRLKIDPRVLKEFSMPTESRHLQSPALRQAGLGEAMSRHLPSPALRQAGLGEAGSSGGLLKRSPHVRYIVHLKSKADLSRVASVAELTQRRQAVVSALRQTAERSQVALLSYLEAQRASGKVTAFTSYWIFNGFAVTSDLETLLAVAARPEVEFVRADQVHHLPPAPVAKGQPSAPLMTEELASPLASIEWNIAKIGADRVWSAYGLRGEGMVVASLDSGVDWTHPALQRKYRGFDPTNPAQSRHDYNWFDATATYPAAPDDGDGHGTHTMGTIVGSLPGVIRIVRTLLSGMTSTPCAQRGFSLCLL